MAEVSAAKKRETAPRLNRLARPNTRQGADERGWRTAHWYWNRLRCMSLPEIAYRVQERIVARLQRSGFWVVQDDPGPSLAARSHSFIARNPGVSAETYAKAAGSICEGSLSIFATEFRHEGIPAWNQDPKTGRVAPLVFGKMLEYRDPTLVGNIKYLWELNRHSHLVTLAQAYRLTGERHYLDTLKTHLESWLDQCPYPLGPNWTSSLELAIRLVNWSIAWQLIDGFDSQLFVGRTGQGLRRRWLASVYRHLHFIRGHLSRYSSANNHLIGELAGLYIGIHTWPFWRRAKAWRQYAKRHLVREALLQNGSDGVNREQAISYQQFVLDFMLLAGLAGAANADDFPVIYWQRIERMIEFVGAIMDAQGNVPMVGDADDGYVARLSPQSDFCPYRSLLATGAILFNRPDFKFKARLFDDKNRWLFGEAGESKFKELDTRSPDLPRRFSEGGYYILGSDFDTEREVRIVVDAGPLGYRSIAAHGHADALAFTLSIGGNEFLVDPGTYAYHTDPEWRAYFRGTRAHNTVCVDGQDQSVQGGNFLWLQHANAKCTIWECENDRDRFVGEQDGYRRLSDPVIHRRELIFKKHESCLEVVDTMECEGRHTIERSWHFAEDVHISIDPDGTIHASKADYALRLRPLTTVCARLYSGALNPPAGWISRRFDVKAATRTVLWTNQTNGTIQLGALLEIVLPSKSVDSTVESVVTNLADA